MKSKRKRKKQEKSETFRQWTEGKSEAEGMSLDSLDFFSHVDDQMKYHKLRNLPDVCRHPYRNLQRQLSILIHGKVMEIVTTSCGYNVTNITLIR